MTPRIQSFQELHIAPFLAKSLEQHAISVPTPIQAAAIPIALQGRDVIGIAQTGTGKTLAFALPMLQNLAEGEVGLVLAPTRELAHQIEETFNKLGAKCVLVVGGAAMGPQVKGLKARHRVIVATPGRLMDHMGQGTVSFKRVACVVLDEADRMLDMGFSPAIKRILAAVPTERQTLLFSATMAPEVSQLAEQFLRDWERVEVERPGKAAELIEQELRYITNDEKMDVLAQLLFAGTGSVLVFARTRHGAKRLCKAIRGMGHAAAEIHSDRSLAQRREALAGFKSGDYRVLVATDIAARGIDVKDISLVVNFDVPDNAEDYVHRIGRTGRAGATGKAITLALPDQSDLIRQIEKITGEEFEISEHSTAQPAAATPKPGRRRKARPADRGGERRAAANPESKAAKILDSHKERGHRAHSEHPQTRNASPANPKEHWRREERTARPQPAKRNFERPAFDGPKPHWKKNDKPAFDGPKPHWKKNDKPAFDGPKPHWKKSDKPAFDGPKPARPQAAKSNTNKGAGKWARNDRPASAPAAKNKGARPEWTKSPKAQRRRPAH